MTCNLKPCPFCGGEAECGEPPHLTVYGYQVFCSKCGSSSGVDGTATEVVEAWNRRVGKETIPRERQLELVGEVMKLFHEAFPDYESYGFTRGAGRSGVYEYRLVCVGHTNGINGASLINGAFVVSADNLGGVCITQGGTKIETEEFLDRFGFELDLWKKRNRRVGE